jgi:SpoIID/LytB domain protein
MRNSEVGCPFHLGTMLVGSRTMSLRRLLAVAACGVLALLGLGTARAEAAKWVVSGAGFGHGTGLSQYGAYGFAKHGVGYAAILAHYYTGTTLGTTADATVRVLLLSNRPSVRFNGATDACGAKLVESKTYTAKRKGGGVRLLNKGGRRIASCGPLLSATGGADVNVVGKGVYRGALEVRAGRVAGVNAINAVGLEDYVRGVIAKESPASWPPDALRAQAVVARSYALSTSKNGAGFDHYDDTRSQAYGGLAAETAKTNQAVADTRLQVVLYQGEVAQTYFFSTSGGATENNENTAIGFGGTPIPYLRGVPDPYDDLSPYHRWTRKFSQASIQAKLGGLVRGKLKNIVVAQTGYSPRIVRATLVGTGGSRNVTGPDLRALLGLPDSWATFRKVRKRTARRAFVSLLAVPPLAGAR